MPGQPHQERRLRTPVAITIAYTDLLKDLDDRILIGPDTYLTAREARRIACDSHLFPAVLGTKSEPLDIGVGAYVVPAHIRRALIFRDGGCAFPSCSAAASVCDAHHVIHWSNHGPTRVDNLVLLCPHHHRLVHRSDWTIQMLNRSPQFIPPACIAPTHHPPTNPGSAIPAPPVIPTRTTSTAARPLAPEPSRTVPARAHLIPNLAPPLQGARGLGGRPVRLGWVVG